MQTRLTPVTERTTEILLSGEEGYETRDIEEKHRDIRSEIVKTTEPGTQVEFIQLSRNRSDDLTSHRSRRTNLSQEEAPQ